MKLTQAPAPGARALIRDEEWIVQSADQCPFGGWQLSCIGVSETVRGRHALYLTQLDDVTLIDPACTELVFDESPTFIASRLYVEASLRQAALRNKAVVLGQHGVMDALPFQLEPDHRVLQQLRPRLLIADTVGLGKTLEAGVLTTELMRRGKARRTDDGNYQPQVPDGTIIERPVLDDTQPGGPVQRTTPYVAPFGLADRAADYRVAWAHFAARES